MSYSNLWDKTRWELFVVILKAYNSIRTIKLTSSKLSPPTVIFLKALHKFYLFKNTDR